MFVSLIEIHGKSAGEIVAEKAIKALKGNMSEGRPKEKSVGEISFLPADEVIF